MTLMRAELCMMGQVSCCVCWPGAPGGPPKAEPGWRRAAAEHSGATLIQYGPIRQCNDLIDCPDRCVLIDVS